MPEQKRNLLRIAAGAYLVYLGISMIKSALTEKPQHWAVFVLFAVVFLVLGAGLVVMELKKPSIVNEPEPEEMPEEAEAPETAGASEAEQASEKEEPVR